MKDPNRDPTNPTWDPAGTPLSFPEYIKINSMEMDSQSSLLVDKQSVQLK